MQTTTTPHHQRLDDAAVATVSVVAKAMRVRQLDRTGAVALVARLSGIPAEELDALLDRAGLLALPL